MKKIIALTLIIITLCIPFNTSFAAETSEDDIAQMMKSLNIMNGYADGSMHLSDKLTRAQFAKIIINASQYKNSVSSKSTTSPFKDVPYSDWSAPYISVAVSNKLITGYPDSSFKPNKNVTLEEAVTVILNLMGYTSDDFGSSWPYGQLSLATNIGLLKNSSAQAGMEITRNDAMQLIYNMLNSNTKSGSAYVDSLGYEMLEDVILIATSDDDSSISAGKISTSSGTYKISSAFNKDNTGKKGNAILNNNDEIICFIPSSEQVTTYTAYAAIDDDIIVASSGGYTESLGLNENTTVYYKGTKTTVENIVSSISVGDIVKVSSSGGNIDYVVVSGNKMQGPVIANNSNWNSIFNIDDTNVSVMRNGNKSSVSDINTNDVLYYSQSLNTLWAYNKKITGIYESASPNKDQPSSITVSGTEYPLETSGAFNKLSSKGTFDIGDSVTLLIGKDGKVADVVSPTETKVSVTGYLTGSGTKEVTNDTGYKYNVNYIEIVTTDGDTLEYESNKSYSSIINSVVTVKFTNGLAAASRASGGSLNGTFDWGNKKIGSTPIAAGINIMDVGTVDSSMNSEYIITYPQRINNVKINSSDILYYSKNNNGEIDNLILKNVTGDALKYGIVTDADVTTSGMSISSKYECDINGNTMSLSSNNSAYTNVKAGQPAAFDTNGNSIVSIKPLSVISAAITDINGVQLETSKGEIYLLSSNVVVYDNTNYTGYSIIPLSDIIGNKGYNIKAYYDKSEASGGRIRIITVTEK
nr:S-layer homology domain-containing protein [Sedimentibacter sp.]